jgi:two-component system response regulator FixJ
VTVYLIDDDDAMRESITLLLETSGVKVAGFASASAFLAVAPTLEAGCILTDVYMPGVDGLELQRRLKEIGVVLPVVIMTGHADVPMAIKALKAGASDFIEKPFKEEALLEAINSALASFRRELERVEERTAVAERLASLTPREREVLAELVAGHPHKVIAAHLGMSPRTVEVHRARIMEKSGAGSLSELVRWTMTAAET